MKTEARVLGALLAFGVLTLWVDAVWAWSLFQVGICGLAAWHAIHRPAVPGRRVASGLAVLAVAASWPLLQLAAGTTASGAITATGALNWWTWLLVFGLSASVGSGVETRRWLLERITGFAAPVAFVSALQSYSSAGRIFWLIPSGYDAEVLGPFLSRNQFAAWIELLLPVALYLALTVRARRSWYVAAAAILFSAVVASASRAGSVLAVAEVLLVAAAAARSKRARPAFSPAALQFVAMAIVAVAVAGWQGLEGRWKNGQQEVVRADAVRASVRMVRERPWMGGGIGTWPMLYPRYASVDMGVYVNQAHNDWAQWAAEGGLPFAALLLIFALLLWKPAVQTIYGVGTLAFLLHALVDYPMQQRPALAAWFFALAGMVLAGSDAANATYDGPLRGTGSRALGHGGRDSSGI